MNETVTKGELARLGIDALDKDRAGRVAVSAVAGGVSFASAMEVMEFAKLMSISDKAVPAHLRANPGICLAVTFQAVEWRMSPFSVANKSYVVNDRLAYESQLIHGVIEARAPLVERLKSEYLGEGPTRQCKVIGHFRGDAEPREYLSPMIKDIRVKNSPLWTADPDQQLWYYSSRAFCRRWAPDVILGIYTKDELAENPVAGREEDQPSGLHAKLAGSTRPAEGFQHDTDHVNRELSQIAPAGGTITVEANPEPKAANEPKRRFSRKRGQQVEKEPEPENPDRQDAKQPDGPTDAASYAVYAEGWIDAEPDKENALARWEGENEMRTNLQVPIRSRIGLLAKIKIKFGIED